MIRIFLIGYMGSGKTTLGKALSVNLGCTFIDLDWFIEERYHKTIGQLFVEYGENGFREIEKKTLNEVSEFEDVIISTGGGTPCFFNNMECMTNSGETVFLDVTIDTLFNRLKIGKAKRPLLADKNNDELKAFIKNGLDKRMPYYTKAKYIFKTDRLDDKNQINDSVEKLKTILFDNRYI